MKNLKWKFLFLKFEKNGPYQHREIKFFNFNFEISKESAITLERNKKMKYFICAMKKILKWKFFGNKSFLKFDMKFSFLKFEKIAYTTRGKWKN
jgi:hypothetical protein